MATNRSTSRTLDVLELLSREKALSLTDIARLLDIPKSSAFDILKPLLDRNYIETINGDKTYRLGYGMFALGNAYRSSLNLYAICLPALITLSRELDKTIFLGVLRNGKVLNLEKQDPSRTLFSEGAVGMLQPMHSTSMGKALLSALSDKEILEIVGPGPYESRTKNTITDYPALIEEIRKTRQRGYATDDSENYEHICCMAMPILDQRGSPAAAISVSSLRTDYLQTDRETVIQALRNQVQSINLRLGYTGDRLC